VGAFLFAWAFEQQVVVSSPILITMAGHNHEVQSAVTIHWTGLDWTTGLALTTKIHFLCMSV
jgi:hypothetical protein